MKKVLLYSIIFITCGWGVSGCGGKKEEKLTGSLETSGMVASVNGEVITAAQLDEATKNIMQQFQGQLPPDQMDQLRPNLRKQALDNLINMTLLLRQASREGIQPGPDAVQERIAEITSRFPSPEQFRQQLADAGVSEETFRREIEQGLKIQTLLDSKAPPGAEISEEEIEEFYRNNPKNFQMQERVRASHILVGHQGASNSTAERSPEEARKRAEEVLEKARAEGADFAALAQEFSEGPTASRGGDLGFFISGQMVKPFEETAFALQSGEISDIVETQFGYHIIQATGREDAREIPLEEVREKIITFLNNQKQQEAINDYLVKLRGAVEIEYAAGFQPLPPPQLPGK